MASPLLALSPSPAAAKVTAIAITTRTETSCVRLPSCCQRTYMSAVPASDKPGSSEPLQRVSPVGERSQIKHCDILRASEG